jgi:hypothetical protein
MNGNHFEFSFLFFISSAFLYDFNRKEKKRRKERKRKVCVALVALTENAVLTFLKLPMVIGCRLSIFLPFP